jgi:hypothetical protein
MDEIDAHETGEGEWALWDADSHLSEAQQEEGDQRNGDLNPHRVLSDAKEAANAQGLFDSAEEEFDSPATLIEIGDFLSGGETYVAGRPVKSALAR